MVEEEDKSPRFDRIFPYLRIVACEGLVWRVACFQCQVDAEDLPSFELILKQIKKNRIKILF